MGAVQWLPVEDHPLADARRQALNVAQWLARLSNSYRAGEPGQPDLALRWRDDGSIATPEFDRDITVELHLRDLSMTFCEAGKPVPHEIDVEERSPAQVEAWILVELLHRGVDRKRFSLALPYEIPDLMSGDAFDYAPEACQAELAELNNWYRNAGAALARVARNAGGGAQVVCLPRNLHLAVFLPVNDSGVHPMIRVGFAPGDEEIEEPYFYVSAETSSAKEKCGAILKASQILAAETPGAAVDSFLDEAVASVRHQAMN
jgi:hypothetical protein